MASYSLLIIDQFASNQAVNLYLTAELQNRQDSDVVPFKQKLINHQQSINELNDEWQSAVTISEVALVIESEIALGFGNEFDSQVSWQSIQFSNNDQISQTAKIFSELLAFVPLGFSSINIHNGEAMATYKSVLIWLGSLLLIAFIIYLVLKPPAIHLLASIALAWLVTGLIYGHNFAQQITFNQQRYAGHTQYLNRIDQGLGDMAKRIDETLAAQSNNPANTKILIMGGENFNNKRLKYHLLQYNVGIIGRYEDMLKIIEQPNVYAVLLTPFNDMCQPENQTAAPVAPNIVLKTTQFCILQW